MPALELFSPCPRGLEGALAGELSALGAEILERPAGGVLYRGDLRLAYAANLHSRLASRVLLRVGARRVRDDDDLYRLGRGIAWEQWFDADATIRVDLTAIRAPIRSANFATLRVKDGIVDRFRENSGRRPSVDTREPRARVYAFVDGRDAVAYLDMSGEPLFKRGWRGRDDKGEAPIKENLAAGLLALSGWDPSAPLLDPFCGSGTIVIEAAQRALGIAPGLARRFAFEGYADFDATLWGQLRAEAARAANPAGRRAPMIAASDIDDTAVVRTADNLVRAGLPPDLVRLRRGDAANADPPFAEPGWIVTNPPYGLRIAMQAAGPAGTRADAHAAAPMRAFGANLRARFGGWHCWVLSADADTPALLGMRASRRVPLFNGAIECRLFGFDIR